MNLNSKKNILAFIPARKNSQGVAGKNLRSIGGKPLLSYSIDAARKSRHVNRIVVSTDGQELADVARDLGAEVPFLRPQEMAGDRSPMSMAIEHCLGELRREGYEPDVLVELYPTHPFRPSGLVDELIEKVLQGIKVAYTACSVPVDTMWGHVSDDSTMERLVIETTANGSFVDSCYFRPYGLCRCTNLQDNATQSEYIYPITDSVSLVDIDTEHDFEVAQAIVKHNLYHS